MIISSIPRSFKNSIWYSTKGFWLILTKALGVFSVIGRRRVPNPAAKIIAFTLFSFIL